VEEKGPTTPIKSKLLNVKWKGEGVCLERDA
jgi:hypothetical protein